mgnify:FL=1
MLLYSIEREFLFPKLSDFSETICRVAGSGADNERWKSQQKNDRGEDLTMLGTLRVCGSGKLRAGSAASAQLRPREVNSEQADDDLKTI